MEGYHLTYFWDYPKGKCTKIDEDVETHKNDLERCKLFTETYYKLEDKLYYVCKECKSGNQPLLDGQRIDKSILNIDLSINGQIYEDILTNGKALACNTVIMEILNILLATIIILH